MMDLHDIAGEINDTVRMMITNILHEIAKEHNLNQNTLIKKYIKRNMFIRLTKSHSKSPNDMVSLDRIQVDGTTYLLDKHDKNKLYTDDEQNPRFVGTLLANNKVKLAQAPSLPAAPAPAARLSEDAA